MNKIFILLSIVAVIIISSCKKDTQAPRPQIVDVPFTLYDLRAPGDTTIFDVNYPSTLILKNDYTWTIDLGGAKSNGTYTWTPTSDRQGEIKFTILSWTDFAGNLVLSDKLKSALQVVNHCGYSLQNPSFANFLINNYQGDYFPSIRTNKK